LSWVPLEAMLCGVPVIASDSTAHPEIMGDTGILVPCEEQAYLPLITKYGPSQLKTKQCKVEDIKNAIVRMATDEELRKTSREKGIVQAREWLDGVSDINLILKEATRDKKIQVAQKKKIKAILFAQHSSAGDVLMTTQCFKGIKEKHPGMKLVYMTKKVYQNIIEGNPHVDKIINWDEKKFWRYEVVYNPHGEKILPGGFNNLDVKLADMYPYFCKVKADAMFIQESAPNFSYRSDDPFLCLTEPFIVVHTTGGQAEYRTYKHIDMALKGISYPIVQIGSKEDLACQVASLDLRGKLSWRETAWVMKRAKAAVCVDSFPMHLAGALGTPVVALFGPAPARVTGPLGDPEKIICLEPNKLDVCSNLTNCWGQPGKNKCLSPCINSINPLTVKKALKKLLDEQSHQEEMAAMAKGSQKSTEIKYQKV